MCDPVAKMLDSEGAPKKEAVRWEGEENALAGELGGAQHSGWQMAWIRQEANVGDATESTIAGANIIMLRLPPGCRPNSLCSLSLPTHQFWSQLPPQRFCRVPTSQPYV